jgi:hypothetical protein
VEAHGQRGEADRAFVGLLALYVRLAGDDLDALDLAAKLSQQGAGDEASMMGTDAGVRSAAERDVRIRFAVELDLVRLRENGLISIGRRPAESDALVGGHEVPLDVRVSRANAGGEGER